METLPLLSCLQETNSGTATTEDKESAQRLLQTLSKWISSSSASHVSSVQSSVFSFLPYLLGYEWFDKDPQLARDCQASLSCLSRSQHTKESIKVLVQEVEKTLSAASWKTRVSCLDFLQAMIFNNFILFCSSNVDTNVSDMRNSVIKMVLECLNDSHLEVRVKAAQVFGGMIHCQFVTTEKYPDIINQLQSTLDTSSPAHVSIVTNGHVVTNRHGAVLGLCSFINAFPHTVPSIIPSLLIYLGRFLHNNQPIPATIKKTVQNWKRTHTDNWAEHCEAFTEDQLSELTNLLVSPSYYA